MAGTIKQTSLSVTISESISLNGVEYGNSIAKTFDGNGKVDQRIMTIQAKEVGGANFTSILGLSTVDEKGVITKTEYNYFRITNTDDAINFNLQLKTTVGAALYNYFQLQPGESFVLMSPDMSGAAAVAAITFADIEEINGQSDSEDTSIDIEYVAVTKGGIIPT